MPTSPIADALPLADDRVTAYNMAHGKSYLRLLDAAAVDADWRHVAAIVLGLDVAGDPVRAERVYVAHFDRAQWMTRVGGGIYSKTISSIEWIRATDFSKLVLHWGWCPGS